MTEWIALVDSYGKASNNEVHRDLQASEINLNADAGEMNTTGYFWRVCAGRFSGPDRLVWAQKQPLESVKCETGCRSRTLKPAASATEIGKVISVAKPLLSGAERHKRYFSFCG